MKGRIYVTVVFFFLTSARVPGEEKPSAELITIQEAYKAAMENLVSGDGTGVYEIYLARRPGKETKLELKVKAKANISFDQGKFYIRLDYEKDDLEHLDSRFIVYDGTAILVNRISKRIKPAQSEGDVYEADPTLEVMRQAGFDYNPCTLPAQILSVDNITEKTTALTIKADANMDYLGAFDLPLVVRCTFLASKSVGYNVINFRQYNTNHNNFQHLNVQATWEHKKGLWYVKSIDRQWLSVDGRGERMVFRYANFEPNVEVDPSLFKFDALSLSPKARLIDRRPNAEKPVLRQHQPPKTDTAKIDSLADKVKALAPKPQKTARPRSRRFRRYSLLVSGVLFCILGLLLIWRRYIRKRQIAPNSE